MDFAVLDDPNSPVSTWYDGTSTDEIKSLLDKSKRAAAAIPEIHSHAVDTVEEIKKFATHGSKSTEAEHTTKVITILKPLNRDDHTNSWDETQKARKSRSVHPN